jgi:Flp pilus assembly protein TadG
MRVPIEFRRQIPSTEGDSMRAVTEREHVTIHSFAARDLFCDKKRTDLAETVAPCPRNASRNFGLLRRANRRRGEAAGNRPGLFGRFLSSRCGVTMVEFALVGPLFLLLTFAIVDNGLVLFTQTILDNATREAARQIQIGKVQLAGDATGNGLFKTTLCNNLGGFIPCGSLQWNVQSVSSAGSFSSITPVSANGSGQMASTGFSPGTAQYFVLVQVGYTQRYIMPFLNKMAGATGNLLLLSNVAFQNEHYQ